MSKEVKEIIFDCGEAEKREARCLLEELNTHTGPEKLASWNVEAKTFLTFAAISRLQGPRCRIR